MASGNILTEQYELTKPKSSKTPPYQIILKQGEPEYLQVLSDETENYQLPNRPEADTDGYLMPVDGTTKGDSINSITLGEYLTTDDTNRVQFINARPSADPDTGGYCQPVGGTTHAKLDAEGYYHAVDDTSDSESTNQLHAGDRRLMPLPSVPGSAEVYEEIPNPVYSKPKARRKLPFVVVGVSVGVLVLIGVVVLLMYFLLPRGSTQVTSSSLTTETSALFPLTVSSLTQQTGGCRTIADIVFILDESSSIWSADFNKQLEFVTVIIDMFKVGPYLNHFGVMTFSTKTNTSILHLGDYVEDKSLMKKRVYEIQQGSGDTRTDLALDAVRTIMFREGGVRPNLPHIAIIITDGTSNYPWHTAASAKLVHDDQIKVFAIGVGDSVLLSELNAIASSPDDVILVNSYRRLTGIKENMAWKLCQVTTPPTIRSRRFAGRNGVS